MQRHGSSGTHTTETDFISYYIKVHLLSIDLPKKNVSSSCDRCPDFSSICIAGLRKKKKTTTKLTCLVSVIQVWLVMSSEMSWPTLSMKLNMLWELMEQNNKIFRQEMTRKQGNPDVRILWYHRLKCHIICTSYKAIRFLFSYDDHFITANVKFSEHIPRKRQASISDQFEC